MSILQLI